MNYHALLWRFHSGDQTLSSVEFLLRGTNKFFWHYDPDLNLTYWTIGIVGSHPIIIDGKHHMFLS